MEQITIDGPKALALIQEITEGKDDFVYSPPDDDTCVYVANSEPSCLIGQALFKAGVTVDELRGMDRQDDTVITLVRLPERVTLTTTAKAIFSAAQTTQDRLGTWGNARDRAVSAAIAYGLLTV